MDKVCTGRVVVLGVGNELLKDEGIGVHVARELARRTITFPVEIIEAGTVPDCWQGDEPVGKLVVIDAVYGGGEPGAIYRFTPEDVEFESSMMTSVHQISLVDSLKLSEVTGNKPQKTVIIGVEPKEVAWGTELSEELRGRIHDVVRIVLKEVIPDQETG
ncbi:MAG TPA: hydrogenase maturation protease [Syntrophobacteraceae bacterium]|nr:hydrogenase maturation protease [Syntrophobacteraceae bacterium]